MTGSFPKHGVISRDEHLSPISATEIKFGERKGPLAAGRRLSCHTELIDDVVIDVPPESQVHRQIIRKDAEHRDIRLNTATRLYFVTLPESTMEVAIGEARLLFDALERDWGLSGLSIEPTELMLLQQALASGDRGITVSVFESRMVTGVWSGLYDRPRGVAVDVGSTTVAAHLCDLTTGDVIATASVMNPQIPFGEDLMSRVSYIMMHPEGAEAMTDVIRGALNDLFGELADQAGCSRSDILEISLVANPIMHHLVLGINPINLGGAPFALTIDDAVKMPARDIALDAHRNARLFVLPCIAGHVGADTAGVILAEAPELGDDMSLVVDVGTNAEIVLGNRDRLLVCSSPTGPAFEGAQISSGQRATVGAIERVRIDRDTLEPRFKIIGSELWSDEPEFAEDTKALNITGICGSGIIEVVAEMFLRAFVMGERERRGIATSQVVVPQPPMQVGRAGMIVGRARPLQPTFGLQPVVTHAGVHGRQRAQLVPEVLWGRVAPLDPHTPCELADDLVVVAALTGWGDRGAHPLHAAFRGRDRAVALGPADRRRQHDVGEFSGSGHEDVLDDEDVEAFEQRPGVLGVGLAVGRIFTDAVRSLDGSLTHRLEHQREVTAVHRVEFHPVDGLELRPMLVVGDVLEAGKFVGQCAHVAAALHIVLPAQRHETRSPAPDVTGEQGEVAQRLHVVDTVVVLGDTERPQDLCLVGGCIGVRSFANGLGRNAGDLLGKGEGVWLDMCPVLVESPRRVGDEGLVVEVGCDDLAAHGVGHRNVGAHVEAQPHVGELC